MRRIELAVVRAVSLTRAPLAAGAQQTEEACRIVGTSTNSEVHDALFRKLKGLSHA